MTWAGPAKTPAVEKQISGFAAQSYGAVSGTGVCVADGVSDDLGAEGGAGTSGKVK